MNKTILLFFILASPYLFAKAIINNTTANYIVRPNTEKALTELQRYINEAKNVYDNDKEYQIDIYRIYCTGRWYNTYHMNKDYEATECLNDINEKGQFKALIATEEELDNKIWTWNYSGIKACTPLLLGAWQRIWVIANAHKDNKITLEGELLNNYLKAIAYYGALESCRPNSSARFQESCFVIPEAAVFTYFCFLKEMDEVENGTNKDILWKDANEKLKLIAFQSWTQPFRSDNTDKNVVQTARFQNHTWWVGANGIRYRPILHAAIMLRSIPMLDVLAEVAQKAISYTSQKTFEDAFWQEGLTADGAGWGHGSQCLIWEYPIQGITEANKLLIYFKRTPWANKMNRANAETLLNFFRGGSWYYYKGHLPLGLSRKTMIKSKSGQQKIPYLDLLTSTINNWADAFTQDELNELKKLKNEAENYNITMLGTSQGLYNGSRYFFNNDDLIYRSLIHYTSVNMASSRCSGLESDKDNSDRYNFFMADGMTQFMKKGDEYKKIYGAMDVTASPGVTAREGMNLITPITNWCGYCSKYNFAGGATNGGKNAVAGFIFQKMFKNDGRTTDTTNSTIFNVGARKGYFFLGYYMIALGNEIKNLDLSLSGNIRTTIDQTSAEEIYTTQNGERELSTNLSKQSLIKEDGSSYWVQQKGKFSYRVLPEYTENAYWKVEERQTQWKEISANNNNVTETKVQVFTAWIDHSQVPSNKLSTYGYVVYAGSTMPSDDLPFTILHNEKQLQAIQSKDGKIIEAIFYDQEQTLVLSNFTIKVSHPCILLMEKNNDEWKIAVTDPTMDETIDEIKLILNGTQEFAVEMPKNEWAGQPAQTTSVITKIAPLFQSKEVYIKGNILYVNNYQDSDISIFTINGICLKTVKNVNGYIDVTPFPAQTYLIKIKNGSTIKTYKVLKRK